MATDLHNESILVNTLVNLKERGIIQYLPAYLSHLCVTQQISRPETYSTQTTFHNNHSNQLIQHQITQGNTSQISSNSSWGKINTPEFPTYDSNKEITFLANSSLDSLQLEDSLQNPSNKESQSEGDKLECIETFQSDSYVAMDNRGEIFDCFPSGFESNSSQNNTTHSNTIDTNMHTEDANLQSRNAPSFKIHNEHSPHDCIDTFDTEFRTPILTGIESKLKDKESLQIVDCSYSKIVMQADENKEIQTDIPGDNIAETSTSKKRGIKRGGEWMVSVDKKGAVLAYEQEHNLIPAINTHIPANPNTQELHESGYTSINTADITTSRCCILHELSSEERDEVIHTAELSSYCYFTLIFSDGSSQLREIARAKNTSEEIEGVMIGLQVGESKGNFSYIFLSFGESNDEYRIFCRELLHKLFSSELMSCVCFDAQELLISLIGHFSISHKDVYSRWSVKDVKVAGWLLDSDHPSHSFLQLKERYSANTEYKSTHNSSRANAYTRAITDIFELDNVYGNIRRALVNENMYELFSELESRVVPILSVMEGEGLAVDVDTLTGMREILHKQINCIEREAHSIAQMPFQLTSPAQVREILFDWLQLDKKCGKSLYLTQKQRAKSTSEQVLESLKSTHPLPGLILQHRKLSKLLSFLQSLLPLIANPQQRLYPCWQQTGAATGRLSCNSPNLQGVPKKSLQLEGEDINIRSVFTSRKNHTLLSVDFRSIELRIVAFLSQEESLCSVFNRRQTESVAIPGEHNTRDIFTELTTQWVGIPYDAVSVTDRENTKRMVYGVIYGIGRERLSEYLMVTPHEAQKRIDNFTNTFPKVKQFMNNIKRECQRYGYVTTLLRRKRHLSHVTADNLQTRMYAERQAVNFVVQGLAADLCKVAMVKLCSRFSRDTGLNTKLLVQIHDELLFEVPDEQLQDTVGIVYETLENDRLLDGFVDFILPLEVKVLTGKSWGNMQEIVDKRKAID